MEGIGFGNLSEWGGEMSKQLHEVQRESQEACGLGSNLRCEIVDAKILGLQT